MTSDPFGKADIWASPTDPFANDPFGDNPFESPPVDYGPCYECSRFNDVVNGVVLEVSRLPLEECRCLVLSPRFQVSRGGEGSHAELAVEKTLHFGGHPPKPIDIRDCRSFFGVAVCREGVRWTLQTYGEWSNFEGGASLRLHMLIPNTVEVEFAASATDVTEADTSSELRSLQALQHGLTANSTSILAWFKQLPIQQQELMMAQLQSGVLEAANKLWWYSGRGPGPGWSVIAGTPIERSQAVHYANLLPMDPCAGSSDPFADSSDPFAKSSDPFA